MANKKMPPVKKKAAVKRSVGAGDILSLIKSVLPHLCIIMSGMFVVFFLIECVNTHQGFLSNEFHKILIFALSLCCTAESVILISYNRRIARAEEKRRLKALREKAARQR